jgi:hypothetical protein
MRLAKIDAHTEEFDVLRARVAESVCAQVSKHQEIARSDGVFLAIQQRHAMSFQNHVKFL